MNTVTDPLNRKKKWLAAIAPAILAFGPTLGNASLVQMAPNHFLIEGYFYSQPAAYKACRGFAAGFPNGSCSLGGGTSVWTGTYSAGFYCVGLNPITRKCLEPKVFYLGHFFFRQSTCSTGYTVDRDTGKCVPSPKNPPVCQGGNSSAGATLIGNPVNAGSGVKGQYESDIQSSNLRFERYYSSARGDSAIGLGPGWSYTLGRRIVVKPLGLWLVVERDEGLAYTFTKEANNNWVSDADITDQLSELKDSAQRRTGWLYRSMASGQTEVYDADGRLLSVSEQNGATRTLTYDLDTASGGDGNAMTLDRITDSFGRTLAIARDTTGKITAITRPSGAMLGFGYDAANNLSTVTYPDGGGKTYHYNEATYMGGANLPNALTGITDENGIRYATYTYDATGRAIATEHFGSVNKHQLSFGNNATTVTDPLGTQRTHGFTTILGVVKSTGQSQPGGSGCGPASSATTYDANGNVASRTDFAGHKSCHASDMPRNLETRRVEGLSANADCASNLANPPASTETAPVRTINTAWHPDWQRETRRAEPEKLTTWVYNGQMDPTAGGAVASCAPSESLLPDGKPIAVLCRKIEQATTDPDGSQGFSASTTGNPRIWSYTYNSRGQILTVDGPRTDVADITAYAYHAADDPDPGKRGNLASITDALGQVTQITAYDPDGNPQAIVDPSGTFTILTYNLRGRLTSMSIGGETTGYTYDPVGQLIGVSLPDGSSLTYTYDGARRLIAIADNLGNRIDYTLDAAGNRLREDIRDAQGVLVKTLSRTYDALGRLQTLTGVENE